MKPQEMGKVGSATAGPPLTGSEDEALLQAMRNLWPLLSTVGRKQAAKTARLKQ